MIETNLLPRVKDVKLQAAFETLQDKPYFAKDFTIRPTEFWIKLPYIREIGFAFDVYLMAQHRQVLAEAASSGKLILPKKGLTGRGPRSFSFSYGVENIYASVALIYGTVNYFGIGSNAKFVNWQEWEIIRQEIYQATEGHPAQKWINPGPVAPIVGLRWPRVLTAEEASKNRVVQAAFRRSQAKVTH